MSANLDSVIARLEVIASDLEEARRLAAEDRIQITRLIQLNQRLIRAGEVVAENLAASIGRADEADADTPGAGADAALRSAGE